ncbi:hypothetical protein, partial [Hoylesella timonensis]|uniref:hypothetical protein n=1 Tax=Hoylesella timonensis TaxID=386414 RepID=UPI000568F7AA
NTIFLTVPILKLKIQHNYIKVKRNNLATMSRIATVKAYCADCHRLTALRIVGGIENLRAILIHNGEDVA